MARHTSDGTGANVTVHRVGWVRRSLRATRHRLHVTSRTLTRRSQRHDRGVISNEPSLSTVSTAALGTSPKAADTFTRPIFSVVAEGITVALEAGRAAITQSASDLLGITSKDDEGCELSTCGFPTRFSPVHTSLGDTSWPLNASPDLQELTATGCKHWGNVWDGRGLLRLKIYDFAIYTNPSQLAEFSQPEPRRRLTRLARRRNVNGPLDVVSNHSIEMSLTVRPARDLPLDAMAAEYHRILRKRMAMNGGDPEDEALQILIKYFDPAKLPSGSTNSKKCIKRDAKLHFCRHRSGTLTAVVDGTVLSTVFSPKLCEAVFDLYLGENPVCRKAKLTAKRTMREMLLDTTPLRD